MMKDLLEQYFAPHYKSNKHALVDCELKKGKFSFADSKACADCKTLTANCDKVVLKIDSHDCDVECIQLERFLNNYANLNSISPFKKCDLLFVDATHIVFCEMTCSMAKYIDSYKMADGTPKIGKRNTVRKQLESSITLLTNVPEIALDINQKTNRIALFAYRVKDVTNSDNFDNRVQSNMQSFKIDLDKVLRVPMFSDIGNRFLYTEIKYPETFIW